MLFGSLEFLFFFAALLVYWLMPWRQARIWLLLAASFYFYAVWNAWLAVLIGATTILDYAIALGMDGGANVSEFWRRWHISLSSWLRDYLFIPLGDSRGGSWKTYRNLMITMTMGGLWHGANWTFVVWGVLHGALRIVHKRFQEFCKYRPRLDRLLQSLPGTLLRMTLTFLGVCVGWVFFRAPTFTIAATVLRRMTAFHAATAGAPMPGLGIVTTIAVVIICHVARRFDLWRKGHGQLPAPMLGFSYAAGLTLALFLAPSGNKPFIYFQF
ncbi:MAG TPA: MBOAT family O-acyltransferase [Gemmataceae bacterium]|jgi:alginate O-acetyltransferase complex protein AlgI